MEVGIKSIAQHYMQAWSAGGVEILDSLAASNITVHYSHFPTSIEGRDQFKEILRQTHTSFPDLRLTVEELFGEANQIAIRWFYSGTHRQGEVLGIASANKQVRVHGITFLRIIDGKVVEERGIVDNYSLLQQLK